MKKQKMLKLTAFPSNPVIENAFSAPVTHSGEVSVVFKGKNVSIHGWDGSSWSTIYTWNSLDPQYQFNNTYQSYYLKSLTGSEETINVSFFSAESYQGSTPLLVGIDRGTKLYDIDEVPIYTADDHNKMLTVMSNGSLAWLLANESFVVPEEGGEEGGGGNVIAGTFIEELASASSNLSNGALITNNVFVKPASASVTLVSLDTDDIVDFNVDGTRTEEEMTLSMWFNPDSTSWTGWKYIAGNAADSNNEFRLAISKDGSGNIEFKTILWDLWTGSPKGISSKPFVAGEWTHLAMTWSYNGSTYDLKLFVDGVKCGELLNQNRNLMKMASNRNFALGALAFGGSVTGSSLPCSIDSVQIKSGTALTDSQVAAIAGQADRQMSIETAAGGTTPAGPSYLESSATLYGDASLSNGSLVLDGTGDYAVIDDGFRFTDRMTTSIWFKTSATGDRRIYSSHVRQMGGSDYRNGFFARLNNGQLKYRHPAGGTGELTGPSGLNDGAWHHLALSWEAGVGYVLYVDGVQRGQGSSGASDGYAAGWGLYIGANPWNNNNPYALFDGEIKNFEVLNEVLTSQQVTDRFNEG
jgi:hypothetical protein